MKRVLWIGAWLVIVVVTILMITSASTLFVRTSKQPSLLESFPSSSASSAFLAMCSGLDVTDEAVRLIAVANCLGRVRGFADGHNMTIKMQGDNQVVTPLWCLGENITDKEVFGAVASWADQNTEKFKQIANSAATPTASLMVIIAALHYQFPCEQ